MSETQFSHGIWTKEYKLDRYREMNKSCKPGQTVFAGSSLMEMFPIEQFVTEDQLDITVYNRGIGGFVTQELIDHLDTCLLDLQPSRLFINIGTNDLSNASVTIDELIKQYGLLLDRVKEALPDCRISLMAYYPVNDDAAVEAMKPVLLIRNNERINAANRAVQALAREKGAQYIDVNAPLKDEQGRLKAAYTIEGMHIKEEGYRAIYPAIKEYLLSQACAK